MRIVLPVQFEHAGGLVDPNAMRDPRLMSFAEDTVEIDMRHAFFRPPGLMWALIYPLLAARRATNVVVRLPRDAERLHWIRSLGLPQILSHAGIEVDAPLQNASQHIHVVLPLRCFRTSSDAEAVITLAVESLERSGLGVANARAVVGPVFSELALNAVQHADSPVAAYGYVQFYERNGQFVVAVADGGVGVRESLRRNRDYRSLGTDAGALEVAFRVGASGTSKAHRGIGLAWVAEELARPGARLAMHSVRGSRFLENGELQNPRGSRLFPGTVVVAWVPT